MDTNNHKKVRLPGEMVHHNIHGKGSIVQIQPGRVLVYFETINRLLTLKESELHD